MKKIILLSILCTLTLIAYSQDDSWRDESRDKFSKKECISGPEYFSDDTERYLYKTIQKHLDDYNTLPTLEILGITINQTVWEDGEQLYDDVIYYLDNLNESKIDNE